MSNIHTFRMYAGPFLLLFLTLFWGIPLSAQTGTSAPDHSLYFATASAELTAQARASLDRLIGEQTGFRHFSLTIEAHTDARGTEAYNEELAQRRAQSVSDYLARNGQSPGEVTVQVFGESQARHPIGADSELQPDRRVDIRVARTGWNGLDAITTELRSGRTQTFRFDSDTEQLLKGDRGGQFWLDAGSLVDATSGQPYRGPVVASLTECYTMDAMLLAQLSTTAQGKLLETGGMLQLTAATPDGRPLTLAEGRKVFASIPTREYDERMRIFYGQDHGADDTPQDWVLTPGRVQTGFEAFLPGQPPVRSVDIGLLLGKYMNSWRQENPAPKRPELADQRRAVDPGKEPDPDTRRYQPRGLFARLFTGKQKRAARELQLYQQAVERHERQQERYAAAEQHNETVATLNAALQTEYQQANRAWRDRLYAYQEQTRTRLAGEYAELIRQDSIDYARWRADRLAQMEAAFAENGVANRRLADRYFFEMSELGWVNCDVFYESTAEQTRILVRGETGEAAPKIMMVLSEPRALLPLNPDRNGDFSSGNVPVGLSSDLIAYKVADGQLLLAEHHFVTSAEQTLELEYRPVAVTELRNVLARYQGS